MANFWAPRYSLPSARRHLALLGRSPRSSIAQYPGQELTASFAAYVQKRAKRFFVGNLLSESTMQLIRRVRRRQGHGSLFPWALLG